MALTMTRTRTQTALTKLAELVANVHGELAFVEGLLAAEPGARAAGVAVHKGLAPEQLRLQLEERRLKLVGDQGSLYATVRRFDSRLDPASIGVSDDWQRRFGSRRLGAKGLVARYIAKLD
jgi:hypothetical protein